MSRFTKSKTLFLSAVFAFLTILAVSVPAQNESAADLKAKARALMNEQKTTEALPLYERLAKLLPDDPEVHLYLGFSLLGQAANSFDAAERKHLRVRARSSFIRASDLGDKSQLVKGMIDGLPPDGSNAQGFSDNAEANRLMEKGEASFARGKIDEALELYLNALRIDPTCYHAALFAGDMNTHKSNFGDAEKWYQRAIAINPNIETAYRYSATPLMRQGKFEQARDRYIEAWIVEPYNRLATQGMIQWAQTTKTSLGHPRIDVPELKPGTDGNLISAVNINPVTDDGSSAWIAYVKTRQSWRKGLFAKRFPKDHEYRHTLLEEAEALRNVVAAARDLKPKTLNDQIATILKLDREGLLEAFIIMGKADAGIAQDHSGYLLTHRDKLRLYVINYVIGQAR